MRKKIAKFIHENTGSSMVIVIVAMAFVGILGATILWMSLNNYFMKATDTKHKESFYSAEMVMEQIIAGLQKDASDAINLSYAAVMQGYSNKNESQRKGQFRDEYILALHKALQGATPDKFDLDKLKAYVDVGLLNGTTRILTSTNCDMVKYESYIVLKDLDLEFEDDRGYVSKIHTDIVLDTPMIDFTQSSTMPDLFTYALIANESLQDTNTNATVIDGSIYGGEKGITISGNMTIQNAEKIVTDADISLVRSSAELKLGGSSAEDKPAIWAENISADAGNLTVHGQAFIADDLTISGTGTKVNLEEEYYGYGNSVAASDQSSAIVINGINSTLDMTQLDNMLVAGHSYIGTKSAVEAIDPSVSGDAIYANNSDIMMGESIAIKGNQIAYLVPDECIDVLDGVARGSNPMTLAKDEEIRNNVTHYAGSTENSYDEVDFDKILSGRSVPLNSYTTTFKRIYCPWTGTGETLVYYYLVMDETSANNYFENYYGYKKDKLDQYFNIYTNGGIKSNNAFTRINMQGNWMRAADDVVGTSSLEVATPMTTAELANESERYGLMFGALKAKLVTNYFEVTDPEKAKSVFENLVKKTDLETFSAAHGSVKTFTVPGTGKLGRPVSINAIVADSDYTYDEGGVYPADVDTKRTRLIVATGDVKIKKDFCGLIIAGGNITVDNGVTAIYSATDEDSKEELTKVLQCEYDTGTEKIRPIDFFVNGGDYILNGTLIDIVSEEEATKGPAVDFSAVVRYENWLKQ